MHILKIKDGGNREAVSVVIRAGDLVSVHGPDGKGYEVTEIITIEGPEIACHFLELAEKSLSDAC